MMRCPRCNAEIQDAAVKCRYCGSWLDNTGESAHPPEPLRSGHSAGDTSPGTGRMSASRYVLMPVLAAVLWLGASYVNHVTTAARVSPPAVEGYEDYSPRTVTYYVYGEDTSQASLTYENGQGGTQQEVVHLPWRKTITAQAGDFIYISAQNENDYGGVIVGIGVDGQPFKESESSGAYTIATASGSCP